MDVTDPDQLEDYTSTTTKGPRFLWQLTTDEAGGVKLFGKGGGPPLITTLYFDFGSGAREIPVAVLPGGRGNVDNPGSQCPATARTFTGIDPSFPARGKVRCYTGADNVAARSLTIVRLDTGEIVRTFRQAATEIVLPNSTAQAKLRARVIAAPLDSPITGQPVAFPSEVGAVADRVFVGDQDGRIWKVNLSSTNPSNWSMSLFFDAYPASYGSDPNFPNTYDSGQPVLLPPTVSVDVNGDVTLNVATGDQDTLGASAGMKNFVWSLTEKTNSSRTYTNSKANWFLPLTGGERVVGPMALFNSALYFASYSPPGAAASVCSNGSSKVWGMHYVLPTTGLGGVELLTQGGRAQLPGSSGVVQFLTAALATGDAGATIFGVTVAQQPTCSTASSQTDSDFLGSGSHTTLSNVNPGKFQLVMHTGSGGTQVDGGTSRVATIPLSEPVSGSRIDSWAALVE
jgi:type IV pilus assembly protein PilY1